MPVYTTLTELGYWLPDNLPATITTTLKTAMIANASSQIDARLTRFELAYNSGTQKFPDVTDSPATPANINEICQMLAASLIYVILKEINKSEYKQGEHLRQLAYDRLLEINRYKEAVYLSDGTKIEPAAHIYHTKANATPVIRAGLGTFDYIVGYESVGVNTSVAVTLHTYAFVNATSLRIEHALGYSPEIWILDNDGNVITAEIKHAADHSYFTITFSEAQSGTVYYR